MITPKLLCLEITGECNLRCRQCHLWQSRDSENTLTTEERIRLVEEMGALSSGGTIVLTSGETMLKGEEFFALTSACRRLGLHCFVNTNGTCLNGRNVGRLLREGPSTLSISVDSHRPELHDWLRGVPGIFDRVVDGIRRLISQRDMSHEIKVQMMSILFDRNIREIEDYVTFATELGVDGVVFQVLAPTFGNRSSQDLFFAEHFPRDPEMWDTAMGTILRLQSEGAPILTAARDLNEARDIAIRKSEGRFPEFTDIQVCDSGNRNLMIDRSGDVMLCFFMRSLTGGRPLGNVRTSTLREIWESEFATETRGIMNTCRKTCGMLNCHRRKESAPLLKS